MDYSSFSTIFILDKLLHNNKLKEIEQQKILRITYDFLRLREGFIKSSIDSKMILHEPKVHYLMGYLNDLNKSRKNQASIVPPSNKHDKLIDESSSIVKDSLDQQSLLQFFNNQIQTPTISLNHFLKLQENLIKLGLLKNLEIGLLCGKLKEKLLYNEAKRNYYFLNQVNEIKFKVFTSQRSRKKAFLKLYDTLFKKILAEDKEMILLIIRNWFKECGFSNNETTFYMNSFSFNQVCNNLDYSKIADHIIKKTLQMRPNDYIMLEKIICSVNGYGNSKIPIYSDEAIHSSVYTKMEASKSIGRFIRINKRN